MKNGASTKSEFCAFDSAVSKILSVSHAELKRRDEKWKAQRKRKKRAKP